MRLKSIKTRKSVKDREPTVKGKVTLTDVSGMERKITEKTRELQNTAQQIRELSDAVYGYDEDGIDEIPVPHGPMIELHLDPDDQLIYPDIELGLNDPVELTENEEETKDKSPIDTAVISSDVSAQELLDEIREIAKIIKERQRG
jgi:hypothetical protein